MMESNDSFFFAVNTAAAASASAANYFPWRRPQLLGSPDLDAPHNRSARRKRKRKSSHGVRRRSSVKDEEENNDNDDDDDDDDEDEEDEENQNPFLLPPNKLTEEDSNPKRCRADRSERTATINPNPNPKTAENGANKDSNEKENSSKQDYIHVRARRGQATDSHSLAERVRREKISERMKLLQNLVPGCNKVMGKALMLDEIINYVQSLQRQVELLSMKLAAVNPLDFCVNGLLRPKDVNSRAQQQQQQVPDLPAQIYRSENSSAGSSYSQRINGTPLEGFENKFVLDELDPSFRGSSISMEYPTLNGFADASQIGNFWEDDLQSVVQMGFFGQSRDAQANNLLSELLRPCGD